MYDTIAQYRQVIGDMPVDDWHPPVMVRLWQLLDPLAGGTAPMFALQVALYAAGFGLIVVALVRVGRWRVAIAAGVLALSPLLLGWQMVVLKDQQMLGALLLATAIVAHYRLMSRKVPLPALVIVAVLIGYATLVRANAIFATVPLAVLLFPPTRERPVLAGACTLVSVVVFIALAPVLNHDIFGAEPSDVAKSEPIFDLAAIAVSTPADASSLFTPAERAEILRRGCVKAYFWDSLSDPAACGNVTQRVRDLPANQLYVALADAAAKHPLAYATHRLAHWNSTERWLVQPGLQDAGPPGEAEPNEFGLAGPDRPLTFAWQDLAGSEAATPLGWPIFWTMTAIMLAPFAWHRRAEPAGGLALALVGSAVALEASFLVISISSDLRYHLWPMTASALSLILLPDMRPKKWQWIARAAVLFSVSAGGIFTRASLPVAPDSYEGMIQSAR